MHFACHLLPFNFAIRIYGGMDFIAKAKQFVVEKYISHQQLIVKVSSRYLVSQLKSPELMSLVSMLHDKPGTVFYKMVDVLWYKQLMEEGVDQGLHLLVILAAILLNEVIVPIQAKLQAQAWSRFHAWE